MTVSYKKLRNLLIDKDMTKTAIEHLSDADAKMLLKCKWIDPLAAALAAVREAMA